MRRVIDVTDLTVWRGNLSGIQRVVYEMAVRYADRSDTVFCYFSEQDRRFYQLTSIDGLLYPDHIEAGETGGASGPRGASRALHHAKRVTKALVPPIVSKVARHGVSRLKNLQSQRERGQMNTFQPGDVPFEFQSCDVLLVYGAHWDKPHYVSTVSEAKERVGIKIVHNINDCIPVYDRAHTAEVEHERFPRYVRAICELSDALLFISEATRRDYERFVKDFNIKNRAKTGVMILGEDINEKELVRPDGIVDEPYILNVGTLEVRKNPVLLYQVYCLAHERGIDLPHLYIVGRIGWLTGDIYYQLVHDDRVNKKITIRNDIDDKGLAWMYKNCKFFVFPSYYEGWGLPVAEAAHHCKATVASHSSSIPEVVGEYADYFSPYSADECLEAIVKMMDDKYRTSREKKLHDRTPLTWDDTYRSAESIVESIVKE